MRKNFIGCEYIHALQSIYRKIGCRGICVSSERLDAARDLLKRDIRKQLSIISKNWGVQVYVGAANKPKIGTSINLNASQGENTSLKFMKDTLGYDIPKISARDEDGNYISKESLNELVLQKMYSSNQFNIPGGDPNIRALLRLRELNVLITRYINANLAYRDSVGYFLSSYNVSGTLTGRRGSKEHVFGFGGNQQNFPKHGDLAKIYRNCLVASKGKILLFVDQMQAEDWPVSCLAQNDEALRDLESGVDRHRKLACLIFDYSWDHYDDATWKESLERYLGKKTRHANNYDMRGNTMSDSLAKEGHSFSPKDCQGILDKVNLVDPSVKGVFHAYIRKQLSDTRKLVTPFGRERIFFGLRAGETSSNNKIYREGYSQIPQSTVGDNTGFAVYELETNPSDSIRGKVIQEGHDSITQEIDDNVDTLWWQIQATNEAFDREIEFKHNGYKIKIPIEGEIGYDFTSTITFKSKSTGTKKLIDLSYQDVKDAYEKLQILREKEQKSHAAQTEQKLDISLCGSN